MKKLCVILSLVLSVCLLFAGCDAATESKSGTIYTAPAAVSPSQNTIVFTPEYTTQGIIESTTEPTTGLTDSYTVPETVPAHTHEYLNGTCTICGERIPDAAEITYVLNVKSMKFHYPSCKTLPTDNRLDTTMSREEIIDAGYSPCGNCKP